MTRKSSSTHLKKASYKKKPAKKKTIKKSLIVKKKSNTRQYKKATKETDKPTLNRFYQPSIEASLQNLFDKSIQRTAPLPVSINGQTMDSINSIPLKAPYQFSTINNITSTPLMNWYAAQTFIGYQLCAIFSQQWLINKCCTVPAEDAVRNGYDITVNDNTEVDATIIDEMRKLDEKFNVNKEMVEFVKLGKVFGIRILMFEIDSPDPDYYIKPFNIDGITAGSYKGITQIDPYWMTPELDASAAGNPASPNFYEPTWWRINSLRVHRTHLCIFMGEEVPDILKPTYFYGGIPLPQLLYERVYAAERTANEAPMLALTKRVNVKKIDLSQALANQAQLEEALAFQVYTRDNYAQQIIDREDDYFQTDTTLTDLDVVIMTQYQIVAAIAKVPATKLLGTSPKGFNATGEYDESNYHEELKNIQTHKLTHFLERHHLLLMKSIIEPKYGIYFKTTVVWKELDAPTQKETVEIEKIKAETDEIRRASGAINAEDIRKRIINDPNSGYNGIISETDILPDIPENPPEISERISV